MKICEDPVCGDLLNDQRIFLKWTGSCRNRIKDLKKY